MSDRRSLPLLLLALLAPLLIAAGPGELGGVVIRLVLEEATTDEVKVLLSGVDGTTSETALRDDGEAPDVTAGDLNYSGSAMVLGDDFQVSLVLGSDTIPAGDVTFPASEGGGRNLVLTRTAGILSTEATLSPSTGAPGGTALPPTGDPAPGAAPSDPPGSGPTGALPMGEAPPSSSGAPAADTTPQTFPQTSPEGGGSEDGGSLYVLLGLGVVALAGVGALWLRGGSDRGRGGAQDPTAPVPEAALLGDGTPSLSDGLSVWRVGAADLPGFTAAMLQHLATHHRVLVVAPATLQVPAVHGGPVYRSPALAPDKVADYADALYDARGAPVAVLVLALEPDAKAIAEYADLLGADMGVVVLAAQDVAVDGPLVEVARDGELWSIASQRHRASRVGLVPA